MCCGNSVKCSYFCNIKNNVNYYSANMSNINSTSIIKSLMAAIPYIGGTITSLWSDIQATQVQRKIERFEQLITTFEEDIDRIKGKINPEYISRPDSVDVFEKMTRYVINERIEKKRVMYKNIYIQSLISDVCDYDKTEMYMRLVEQMGLIELYLLKIFENPVEFNFKHGNIIKNPFLDENGNWFSSYMKNYSIMELLPKLLPQYTIDTIEEGLYLLEQNRLILGKTNHKIFTTNGDPINIFDNILTKKGKEFVAYLYSE